MKNKKLVELAEHILANGLESLTYYGLYVISGEAYIEAKEDIKAKEYVFFETILAHSLNLGYMVEFEDVELEETVGFTLKSLKEAIETPEGALLLAEIESEHDDAETAEKLLQIAMYGKVVFA